MKINARQQKFADEYIISGNILQSAIKAGYSEKYANAMGYKLLENIGIKAYLEEKRKQIDKEKIAEAQEVMEYLTSVIRGTTESEIVVTEFQGDGVSQARRMNKAPDEKDRLKAADMLCKIQGLYDNKLKIEGELPVVLSGGEDLED